MSMDEFESFTLVQIGRLLRHSEKHNQRFYEVPPARLAAIILNMFRDEKERPDPFTVADILPHLAGDMPVVSEEDRARAQMEHMLNMAKAMTLRFGGKIEMPDVLDTTVAAEPTSF